MIHHYLYYTERRPPCNRVWLCLTCGAVVHDRAVHDDYHSYVQRAVDQFTPKIG